MRHIPIAICDTNIDHLEDVIEQLKPEYEGASLPAGSFDLPTNA